MCIESPCTDSDTQHLSTTELRNNVNGDIGMQKSENMKPSLLQQNNSNFLYYTYWTMYRIAKLSCKSDLDFHAL